MPDQPELRQRLAKIVDEHWPSGGGNYCEGCDWSLDRTFWKGERTSGWANHVADALLALPGIAIVSADDIRRALRHMDPAASLDEQRLRAKAQLALLAAADAVEAQTNA